MRPYRQMREMIQALLRCRVSVVAILPVRHGGLRLAARHASLRLLQSRDRIMSTCVFIQIRCKPGTTYKVAEDIALREIHSELYSTSGEYDLLMKLYIPQDKDVGKYINDQLLDIVGIERSLTTMTFKVF